MTMLFNGEVIGCCVWLFVMMLSSNVGGDGEEVVGFMLLAMALAGSSRRVVVKRSISMERIRKGGEW